MIYDSISVTLRYYPVILLILIQACTAVPDADFYEVDGIVSIGSEDIGRHQGWELIEQHSAISLISVADTETDADPLVFPFYIRVAGIYSVWILCNRNQYGSERDLITLSLSDEEDNRLFQTLLKIESTPTLRWINRDYDNSPISFQVDSPGYYKLGIRSMGLEGYIINKIHLTRNNEHPPWGIGLPVTSDPFLDPLLLKREQRMELPPAEVLGPVYGGYSGRVNGVMTAEIQRRYSIAENEIREWEKSPDFGQYKISDLRKNIEFIANPRLITYELPFASYNTGGINYMEVPSIDMELLIRWTQFSAFNSVMHLFTEEIYDRLTDEGKLTQESRNHIDNLIRLRRRLLPYINSGNHLARSTSVKSILGNSEYPTQFMFGDSFLVAPVYEPGADERFVRLPSGIWYDYFDGTRYEGGQSWLVEAPKHRIPVFVRAGSIIPYRMESDLLYISHFDSLLIEIYGGSVGTFRLYEDDGLSTRYKRGQFSTTAFRYFERDDYATFTIGRMVREFEWQSPKKRLTLHFMYVRKPISVSANDRELSEGEGLEQWFYDDEKEKLIIRWVQPNDIKTDFEIEYSTDQINYSDH